MLGDYKQTRLSEYARIYDILIPRDHIFRRMNEEIDFSFVRKELEGKYSDGMGRSAEDPVRMFKYLMLKAMHPASDVDLVERAYTDMQYKFFLGLNPEDEVIDPSLLSKFRRQRLKDVDLLNLLISRSVDMAISKGIIKRKSDLIVDATHELSAFKVYSPLEYMKKMCQQISKACEPFWGNDFDRSLIPDIPCTDEKEDMRKYCRTLISNLERSGMSQIPAIACKVNLLKEGLEDMDQYRVVSRDGDARFGNKGYGKTFFGYKAHIGMTPESIIVSATVSSGEMSDGAFLVPLIEQAKVNGLAVESVIGDTAYSGKENLDALKDKIDVVAPLNPVISQGSRQGNSGFHYNKDADAYVCPAGETSVRKDYKKPTLKKRDDNGELTQKYHNGHVTYYFDVKKCKDCPLRDGCYKGGKTKSYTVMILSETHKDQMEFEKTKEFKQKIKLRKRIEPLNAHLKNDLGMKQNISYGIESMTMQTAVAIYMSNIQKIMKFEG